MSAELEQQIVAALSDDTATGDALAALVADTEVAINEADAAAEAARVAFLDPIESPDANAARAVMETTQYAADRLRTLSPRLEARYREVAGAEDLTQWRTKYEVLKSERDVLAAELREVYPDACAAIVSVLARVTAYEHRASALHQSRPSGVKGYLPGPDLVARGLTDFSRDDPPVARDLKLPSWSESNKLIWPPPQPSLGVIIALSMPTSDPRYSRDWP
jgi:hypothetical protein